VPVTAIDPHIQAALNDSSSPWGHLLRELFVTGPGDPAHYLNGIRDYSLYPPSDDPRTVRYIGREDQLVITDWVSATSFGADPTATIDSTAALQAAINAGPCCYIPAGTYVITSPLIIPPYTAVIGSPNTTRVAQVYGGTVIQIDPSFAGHTITDSGSVTLSSAFLFLGQSFAGYTGVSQEQKLMDIMIDGTHGPAGVSGIISYGRLQRVRLYRVLVSKMTGDGVAQIVDAAGNQPDAFYGFEVFCRYGSGKGFILRSADSTWSECLTTNNGDPEVDWFINTTSNSKYFNCRSEHAAGVGFGYVCVNSGQASGGVEFNGCSTDQSNLHGFKLGGTINGITSFTHATPVALTGCNLRRDGSNGGAGGGGYASLYNAGYGSQVVVDGLTIWPGVNDDGTGSNSPQIGILADSGSRMGIAASFICAAATAISDSSGGTVILSNSVSTATGATGSPTFATPGAGPLTGTSLSLSPAAAPASDPLFILNQNAGERAIGLRVVGGSNDRWKVTSSGVQSWGGGPATQDVALLRPAAGILQVTDASIGGSAMLRVAASSSQAGSAELLSAVANAATDIALVSRITADAFARLAVDASGKHSWGSGAGAADAVLYRSAVGLLKTDTALEVGTALTVDGSATAPSVAVNPASAPAVDPLIINSANSGERAFGIRVTGQSNDRFKLTSDGKIQLGPGSATQDTFLERTGTAAMKVTGSLTVTGSVIQSLLAAPASFKPSDPPSTTSATAVMAGFGATVAYTPGSSGKVLVIVSGEGNTATASVVFNVGARYGTGTAPAQGVAVTGTRFGPGVDYQPRSGAASVQSEFSFNEVLSLTAGTAYWFDLSYFPSNTADACLIRNVVFSLVELG
jgi:hypothetical protein